MPDVFHKICRMPDIRQLPDAGLPDIRRLPDAGLPDFLPDFRPKKCVSTSQSNCPKGLDGY